MSSRLTTERLFSDPPLAPSIPTGVAFAPGGQLATYLRVSADDRERMDLWCYDFASQSHRCLLDARDAAVSKDVTELTAVERADRERRRQFAFGITEYEWHPSDLSLLVPVDGQGFLVDVSKSEPRWQELTERGTRQTAFKFSPRGRYVSYVRDGNLFVRELAGAERQLTTDASETMTNGLPDFLAAEEMHRFRGTWWAPDERSIAYTKVDESGVPVSHRLEIDADGSRTVAQRYPYAGGPNPQVELHVFDLESGADQLVWSSSDEVPYLARVHYNELGLFITTQDRLQQRLELGQLQGDTWKTWFVDESPTWVNLSDDFKVVGDELVLTTETQRGRGVTFVDAAGSLRDRTGPAYVDKVLFASPERVLVSGWDESPIERHLFSIEEDRYTRLTDEAGWHDLTMARDGDRFVDVFTSDRVPLRLGVGETAQPDQPATLHSETLHGDHPYSEFLGSHAYAEFGTIAAEDGQTLHYRLTPPRSITGVHPVVLFVYGGPGAQLVRRSWSPGLLQLLAEHGFGVLEVDNRGSANRGRDFEGAIFRAMGGPEVRDQVRGLAVLDDVAWADPARVGVFGHSYGGYMSLMCLCQAGEHFRAGVAVAPVCDWRLYDTHYTERFLGLPDVETEAYDGGNVLTHLERLETPLLLMHGMADDNVLFTHTTMIMDELQKLGKRFELMTYPGAKHSMQERHVSIHRFNLLLDFFARELGGVE